MATTQPPTGTPSTSPSPSPMSTNNASTLLFGFLVSALSIFAVFMTIAIVWNRLIARRHAMDALLVMGSPEESLRPRRPIIWDIWAMPDKQPPPWPDFKPVAVQKCDCPPRSLRTRETEQTTPFWGRYLWDRLPPEITCLFHRPVPPTPFSSSDTDISHVELSHGSDVQISLLIAMPHALQSTRKGMHEDHHMFHELVFATTNVLYHDPATS